ncbi:MAG: hypothetical protein ACI8QZ_002571 [Chlamydiales bacterium]|jgi:hypothetical protein
MQARIRALVHATLAGEWLGPKGSQLPVATVLFHFSLSALLCGIASDQLSAYGYGVFALSIPLALATLPLLGELAPLLRADPAHEWISAQPVRPAEIRIARVIVIAVMLGVMTLGSASAAAMLAPDEMSIASRLLLIVAALCQTLAVAAALLWIQAALGERAEILLVLLQTVLFCGLILGTVFGLSWVHELAGWSGPQESALPYPPTWFASWLLPWDALAGARRELWISLGAVLFGVGTLAIAPFPPPPRARSTRTPLSTLLTPFRRLAQRFWVRRDERGVFDFVYDALPSERDFVMRTYPLVAIPVAFLLLGAGADDPQGEGLLAILLFAPATYLPILLAHVPATSTPNARWILDTAPLCPSAEREGALKAIAVRFLLPLGMALALVTCTQGGVAFTLRLALPAAVATVIALRVLWPLCVERPPLSTPASDLGTAWKNDFTGILFALAAATTIGAIATWRLVKTPEMGIGIAVVGVLIELARTRFTTGRASDQVEAS